MVTKSNQSPKASEEKTKNSQANWPDFAVSLYDKLTGRGAEITYEFDDFNLAIPSKAGKESDHFHWKMDGIINIRTTDQVNHSENSENAE
jgi:hypothetical protein